MGCVASKKAVCPTPLFDPSSRKPEGSTGILTNSLWDHAKEDTDHSDCGEYEKISIKSTSTRSLRLGNLHKYIEGEQVAAGWPSWISSVAKEAIHGWVPLKAENYEKMEKVGQGTYSSVFKARDLESGKMVALKKVRFDNFEPESVRFMAREILILRRLDHPNIMKLDGIITSRVSSSIYLVFEYMEHDLSGLSSSPNIKFTESQVKCYMHQLLSGLEHCHRRGVMHRDIKCANLLVNNEGMLKMADFGLANFYNPVQKQPLTSRVVTLWYRPPELLMGSTDYEASVDLWSVGCVFAEMFLKKPILQGRTEVEQIHKILKLCGSPPEDFWRKAKLPHATLFKPNQPYDSCLRETFKSFSESTFSLLETFLSVEPYKRGSATTALGSEYFRTKPYACEPSSLPKYPPSKEIDAKLRDELNRKRAVVRGRELNTMGPSKTFTVREPNVPSKLPALREDLRIRNGPNKTSVKRDLIKRNSDNRLFVDLQPMPTINFRDEGQKSKHTLQEKAPESARSSVSSTNGITWAKLQKDDRPFVRTKSRTDSRRSHSGQFESINVLQAKNNYDIKGHMQDTRADYKARKSCDITKRMMLKQWGQVEHPASFDASDYRSKDLSEAIYKRETVSPKHGSLRYQDPADRVEFSGPLLSQTHKVDELLERHERQIRQAGRRSWFQKGKK